MKLPVPTPLSRDEQVDIATALSNSILQRFVAAVRDGRVPEGWNGYEIRQYMYEQFQREWEGTVQEVMSSRTKRGRAYLSARNQRSF